MIKSRSMKRIGTLAGILSAAILLTVTQASAVTAETERATDANGPVGVDSWDCASSGESASCGESASVGWNAAVCYSGVGDWFHLYDGKSDGSSAVVDWVIRDAQDRTVRYGAVFDADGAGAVRYKNKDFPDGSNDTIRFRACLGRWSTKLITAGTCSAWVTRQN
ncbi:hypothetical protein ACWD3I_40495 [Streptomyces sp. NPDC002817]|uniref:hypothetical protein n=1 Tax=Streptomyces sp. NPDC088357 TaxID=3154655 RepID=UPI003418226B